MVDEEADLALDSLQARRRQLRLAQGSASDRERVDRVRLAADARAAARAGHELGRDAHDLLARSQQEALERDGDVPAVLERPHSLVGKAARPAQELLVTGTPCLHRALGEQLADSVIDGRGGVRCLVWVYSDFFLTDSATTEVAIDKGVPADRPQWGRKATLLSGHAGAPRTAAGDRSHAGQASRPTASLGVSPPPAPSLTGTTVTSRSVRTRMTLRETLVPARHEDLFGDH